MGYRTKILGETGPAFREFTTSKPVASLLAITRYVLLSPRRFFDWLPPDRALRPPVLYFLICCLIGSVLEVASTAPFLEEPVSVVLLIALLAQLPILFFILLPIQHTLFFFPRGRRATRYGHDLAGLVLCRGSHSPHSLDTARRSPRRSAPCIRPDHRSQESSQRFGRAGATAKLAPCGALLHPRGERHNLRVQGGARSDAGAAALLRLLSSAGEVRGPPAGHHGRGSASGQQRGSREGREAARRLLRR